MKSNFKYISDYFYFKGRKYHLYRDFKQDCYKIVWNNRIIELKNKEDIEYAKRKEQNLDRRSKQIKKHMAWLIALGITIPFGTYKYLSQEYESEIEYYHSNQDMNNRIFLFDKCVDENKTIPDAFKEELKTYLHLFAQYETDMAPIYIARKIKKGDFSSYTQITPLFLYEVFDVKNGQFIANQLYFNLHKHVNCTERETQLASYLYFNEEDLLQVLNGSSDQIEFSYNDKEYSFSIDKINEISDSLLEVLKSYSKEQFWKKANYTTLQPDVIVKSNLFSSYVPVYSIDNQFHCYYLKEDENLVEVTAQVYKEKLREKFLNIGDSFDYNNPDYRKLFYFYIDSVICHSLHPELKSDDITSYVFDCKKEVVFPAHQVYNYHALLRYLDSGIFCYDYLPQLSGIVFFPDTLVLIKELNLCLQHEFLEGNITAEMYACFCTEIRAFINPLDYELLMNSILNNESIEFNFTRTLDISV